MSVSTINEHVEIGIGARIATYFSNLYAAVIRGREAQGRRYVALHLSQFDDRTLESAGFNRDELTELMKRPRDLAAF